MIQSYLIDLKNMNPQTLTKINGFVKNRLIELSSSIIILIDVFLLLSILSYSPSDPNFIYNPENITINNIGGFYGSVISDLLLQAFGIISFFIILNLFVWGIKLFIRKKISNFITKVFFTFIYIISGTFFISNFSNNSFWLVDNGNGGFVGKIIKEKLHIFLSLNDNLYFNYSLLLISLIFFILSLDLRINEILKIVSFPFLIFKKFIRLFTKENKETSSSRFKISSLSLPSNCA